MTNALDLLVLPLIVITLIAIAFALNSLSLLATAVIAGALFVFDLAYVSAITFVRNVTDKHPS
jgi:hypothetical protein